MVALNPSHSPATVIGGNKVNAGANATKDVAGRPVYLFLQYLTSVMALVSCLLWMVQYVVIPTTGAAVSWEFVLFVAYLQRMASLSHSVTRRVPYFLWEYVDAFSWTVFMPFHNAAAGVARRRLDEVVVVLDVVVASADRIGVKESTLLNRGVIGMLYVIFPASDAAVSWEFVLFVGYAQRMASLSHVVARRVPYFLWEYVDAFSWTVFVPFHKNVATESAQRRLDDVVVVLDGVVAFADRIGMKESTLLNRGVIGMLVAAGIVGLVIIVAWSIKLCSKRSYQGLSDTWSSDDQKSRSLGWIDLVVSWR
ncbi:hypothetical protein Poli38472_003795 [Pythium oligandrum]|uniref:Uncharacterized protein n=1 Tax=Pythium oligandrum TaxID=41045 RepID=A0A8K1FJG0_PYTOL|nr:hypothetical protein Poli38472_003795 [Pythium oligandrum]|eukprot:TMW66030.1 hypothetical protein Poli38472_003795 [Pythium oligandrum]